MQGIDIFEKKKKKCLEHANYEWKKFKWIHFKQQSGCLQH